LRWVCGNKETLGKVEKMFGKKNFLDGEMRMRRILVEKFLSLKKNF